ncbi:tetratricopeptide repeat protein [Candidatus Parcubacteria bacterium]|nr:tetratricopeptide repeat protein [Patescibacteria group bacterium]MBU4466976.1 tetratricopeptide repeat protein [Patescibacteria group bacterium]MCG2688609.1 tetratricopeptide repeat protein [Candidatus Parcubacteria bacterium]
MLDTSTQTRSWQKLSRTGIFLLVFLLPLFFLPSTSNVLDFNKQILLTVLVLVSLFAWLLKSLIEEKISLDLSWFSLPAFVFVLIIGLSTLGSAYQYASFWGWPLVISSSFLTTLALVLFYFLVSNLFKKPEDIFGLILVLAVSGLLVSMIALPHLLGKFPFPFDFSKSTSFNTIGSVNSLAIFLATVLPLAASVIFVSKSKLVKGLVWLFIALSLLVLLAVNFQTAWLVLLISSSVILIFGISRREVFSLSWLFLPMLFLAMALFALVMRTAVFPTIDLPAEVSPSLGASFNIAWQTLKSFRSPLSWLVGSGPGTFIYDYSMYKPIEINQTAFWGTRFGSGSSEMTDRLATTGIFGFLSFIGVILVSAWVGFKAVISREAKKESLTWVMTIGVFASFVGAVVSLLFYPSNLSLMFLFWLLVALIFSLAGSKTKTFNFQALAEPVEGAVQVKKSKLSASWITVVVSFAFITVLIISMVVFFSQGQRFFAETNYLNALVEVQKGNNDAAINYLSKAVRLTNGKQDNYWRDLSQVYLFRINDELQKQNLTQEQMSQNVGNLISLLVEAAKSSTDSATKNVANWTVRGYVYNNIMSLIQGSDEWAIKAYEEAAKLDPTNPFIYTAIGQVYGTRADNLAQDKEKGAEKQEALNKARQNFEKALQLKSDYAQARFQLAMIDIRENKISDAITKLEETKVLAPFDTGLGFQLGLIYQADNQINKAQAEFERVVVLDPNYANARYFLGLIYDNKKETQKAIEQFEKIAELNQDNTLIRGIIENLKAGKPALEGLTEPEPPIQETPEEQLTPGTEAEASPSPSPAKKP